MVTPSVQQCYDWVADIKYKMFRSPFYSWGNNGMELNLKLITLSYLFNIFYNYQIKYFLKFNFNYYFKLTILSYFKF